MNEFWKGFKSGLVNGFVVGAIVGFIFLVIDVKPIAKDIRNAVKSTNINVVQDVPFKWEFPKALEEERTNSNISFANQLCYKYDVEMGGFYMEEK